MRQTIGLFCIRECNCRICSPETALRYVDLDHYNSRFASFYLCSGVIAMSELHFCAGIALVNKHCFAAFRM